MTAGDEVKPSETESKVVNGTTSSSDEEVKETSPPSGSGRGETGVEEPAAAPVPPAAAASPAPALPVKPTEPNKLTFRIQTWDKLESMEQVVFPRPCKYRIPRFKGENEAVEKLAELEVFKEAKVVKVNLDKAHERVRLEVIQTGKSLVAGTPGLKEAVFLLMRPPMEANKLANKMAASRIGIRHLGIALDFASGIKIDLIVLGSVAVDRKGHRIGKGEGFTDLEYALLSKLGVIDPEATIVTVVHDLQVYDEFPESLFKSWDVPVDIIITPTQVIHVDKKLPRPQLAWNFLSNRRVNDIPIIKHLMEKAQLSGEKVELKEEDSDTEGTPSYWPPLRSRRGFRFSRRRRLTSAPPDGVPPSRGGGGPNSSRGSSAPPPPPQSSRRNNPRTFHQRNRRPFYQPVNGMMGNDRLMRMNMNNKTGGGAGGGRRLGNGPGGIRKARKPRYQVDFSIRVDGLTAGVRIRELKAALHERKVHPVDISWRASKGIALLHFAKKRAALAPGAAIQENGEEQEPPAAASAADGERTEGGPVNNKSYGGATMEEVVELLQGLAIITGDGVPTPQLKVEGVKPIPRGVEEKGVSSTGPGEGGDGPRGAATATEVAPAAKEEGGSSGSSSNSPPPAAAPASQPASAPAPASQPAASLPPPTVPPAPIAA